MGITVLNPAPGAPALQLISVPFLSEAHVKALLALAARLGLHLGMWEDRQVKHSQDEGACECTIPSGLPHQLLCTTELALASFPLSRFEVPFKRVNGKTVAMTFSPAQGPREPPHSHARQRGNQGSGRADGVALARRPLLRRLAPLLRAGQGAGGSARHAPRSCRRRRGSGGQRGGRRRACASELRTLEQDTLGSMRAADGSALRTLRGGAADGLDGLRAVLLRAVPRPAGACAEDGERATRSEIEGFLRAYTKLVRIRLQVVPVLLDGLAPADVLEAQSVELEADTSLCLVGKASPTMLRMRMLLRELARARQRSVMRFALLPAAFVAACWALLLAAWLLSVWLWLEALRPSLRLAARHLELELPPLLGQSCSQRLLLALAALASGALTGRSLRGFLAAPLDCTPDEVRALASP